jgi:hypothetical protein
MPSPTLIPNQPTVTIVKQYPAVQAVRTGLRAFSLRQIPQGTVPLDSGDGQNWVSSNWSSRDRAPLVSDGWGAPNRRWYRMAPT